MALIIAELTFGGVVLWLLPACGLAMATLFYLQPILLVRTGMWIFRHTLYKVRVIGREHLPATGPALLVCNHVSYLDFFFLLAAQRRYIHFVIFAGWTRVWGLRRILKWAGVIPIDKSAGPRALVQSLRQASEALARGEVVCIFAEGRFTRTGFLLPFHRGFEQIVKHCAAPIIPVCLEQVWGSVFSYWGGKLIWKWPLEIPYPVTVAFGAALAPTASPAEVRMAVHKLSADCAIERSARSRPAHRQFVRTASRWRQFRKPCIIDSAAPRQGMFTYGKVLTESVCLSRVLRSRLQPADSPLVGVWLPPGAPAALANIALALLGKAAVNLDDATSPEKVQSAIRQCKLRHVLTSRAFTAQQPFTPGPSVELLYVEDLAAEVMLWQRLRIAAASLLLPNFILDRWVLRLGRHKPDDLLTVILPDGNGDKGSDGKQRGVQLSHRNITANVESLTQVIDAGPRDRLLGVFPFSQGLGYTMTLWLPLQIGASVVYHADPRDGKTVGDLCKQHGCTIFLSTPELLPNYLAACAPGDFASLRFLWCGGESLSPELAQEFLEKQNVLLLLGYGQTELSPAATLNVPDKDLDGFRQVGNRPGTIGQPLPGVAARIVDPATFTPLPPGQAGLLLFYGANVMAGYLGDPTATAQAIRDGWFFTGETAALDEDRFITLTVQSQA